MAYKKIPDYEEIIRIENIEKFKRGESYDSYNFLGCHKSRYNGKIGFCFNVWAPNARQVFLTGDFNNWDRGAYPMINNQFASHLPEEVLYVNRGDDFGDPGLRQAKLSYKPEMMIEKFAATLA